MISKRVISLTILWLIAFPISAWSSQTCWLHQEGKFIEFDWVINPKRSVFSVDNNLDPLFVFEVENAIGKWVCERIKDDLDT